MSRYRSDLDCKVYVGELPRDATDKELDRAFSFYGPLKSVWVARNPPGFAFVEFEDPRDADDAVKALDGTTICGSRARVEHSNGKVRPKSWQQRGPSRKSFDPSDRCYQCGERGHYAYDCRTNRGGGSRRRSRSRSPNRRRSYSRSRSRSRDRYSRSRSRTPRRSSRRTRSRSRSYSRSPSRHHSD